MISKAEEFHQLQTREDPAEYQRALVEEAPESVWFQVIRHWPEMAFWVAQNKTLQPAVLYHLARNPDAKVRETLARHPRLPERLQITLTKDPEGSVRLNLASSPHVAKRVHDMLRRDDWEPVREKASKWHDYDPLSAVGLQRASGIRMFLSTAIDLFLALSGAFIIAVVCHFGNPATGIHAPLRIEALINDVSLLAPALHLLNCLLGFCFLGSQSIGMIIFGIRFVSSSDGKPCKPSTFIFTPTEVVRTSRAAFNPW